jgi:hypothetical protein
MRPLRDIFENLPTFDEMIDAIVMAPEPPEPVENVVATARIGSRVIRIIGTPRVTRLEVAMQLDLFLEFVKREARRAPATCAERCQDTSALEL